MDTSLSLLPPALVPPGLRLPRDIADVLPLLGTLPQAANPGEQHLLLRRGDSKFAVARAQVPRLLQAVSSDYVLLTAAGNAAATYVTVYFDTQDHRFLSDHLRSRRPRHKVRVRHYLDRQLSFMEIKSKTRAERTEKQQRARAYGGNDLSSDERAWAATVTGYREALQVSAWSSCQRLTLLRRGGSARLTVDLNVALGSAAGAHQLLGYALVELKQDAGRAERLLMRELRAAHAVPAGLSKYVAAMMGSSPVLPRARYLSVLGRFARPEFWGECYS